MKYFDINNHYYIYSNANGISGSKEHKRSGFSPMSEAELLKRLSQALQLQEGLALAIEDMRALLASDPAEKSDG